MVGWRCTAVGGTERAYTFKNVQLVATGCGLFPVDSFLRRCNLLNTFESANEDLLQNNGVTAVLPFQ